MRKLTCKEQIPWACPGSADSWQGSSSAASAARVCGQQGWGSEWTWAVSLHGCVLWAVCEFTGNYPSPFKGPGCSSVLAAVSLFFIVLEALLKCPQAMLQLLGFSLPKPSWLFGFPSLVCARFNKVLMAWPKSWNCSVLQHFGEIAKPASVWRHLWK